MQGCNDLWRGRQGGHAQQRVVGQSIHICRDFCISTLGREHDTTGSSRTTSTNSSLQSRGVARPGHGSTSHIHHSPAAGQTGGGGVQTKGNGTVFVSHSANCLQCSQRGARARCSACNVLGRREQGIGRRAVHGISSQDTVLALHAVDVGGRNVSHVEDFNVAFQGLGSLLLSREGCRQATRAKSHASGGNGGLRAAVVGGGQHGTAIGTLGHIGGPHVARRQEHLEVQQVVGVGGAAETDLHGLAVHGVGIHHAQQRGIAVLGGEIRHHQNVANTGGGNTESRCVGQVSQASSRCSRSCNAGTDLSHASVCHTSHTQTANQGSNAQREKIFLHGNSS